MNFIHSLFLGTNGTYQILDLEIEFKDEGRTHDRLQDIKGAGFVSSIASKFLSCRPLCILTFGYMHVLVHEMSHALAHKILLGESQQITVDTDTCTGSIWGSSEGRFPEWRRTIFSAAGPAGSIAFSTIIMVAAAALKRYISWPVAFSLRAGAVTWITGEWLYISLSAYKNDNGDFGQIRRHGSLNLSLASAAIAAETVFGFYLTSQLS